MPHSQNRTVGLWDRPEKLLSSHNVVFLSLVSHKSTAAYHFLIDFYLKDDIVALCLKVNQIN